MSLPLVQLLIITVVLISIFSKRKGRALAIFSGCLLVMVTMWFVTYEPAQHLQAGVPTRSSELATQQKQHEPISLNAEWEQFNRSHIILDDEETAEPSAPSRPGWVESSPKVVGNVYRVAVVSDPFETIAECEHGLQRDQLRGPVERRITHLTGVTEVPALETLGLDPAHLLSELESERWGETRELSVGEMKRLHVLLEFTAPVDKQLQEAYRGYLRLRRVGEVGTIAGVILGGLVFLYGMLRLGFWNRGSEIVGTAT